MSSACKLCAERQTLLHVLNNCPKALNMSTCIGIISGGILEGISKFMSKRTRGIPTPGRPPTIPALCLPPHIATTDQWPNIVVWSSTIQEVWVIELTVCFETRYAILGSHKVRVTRNRTDSQPPLTSSLREYSLYNILSYV